MASRAFDPADARKLDDPERLKWLPPGEVMDLLDLRPGMTVADIGAGTGYFALPAAQAVGRHGKVFAVDLQPEMLDKLREKLGCGPANIEVLQGEAGHTGLPADSCDVVLLANLWHEIRDHAAALREAARVLKEEGRLAIIDWRADVPQPPGPPLDHRIPMEKAVHALENHGWTVHHFGAAGRYSYALIATPTDESVQS